VARVDATKDVLASVFIPVLNGGPLLAEVVDAVLAQQTEFPFEVFAIDSGSSDGSLRVLSSRGIRTDQIPNADFGHGRTRNRAMRLAKGQFVAFLTQDATPASPRWLAAMVQALDDPQVASAWGPQVPRPGADARTARILTEVYDAIPRTVSSAEQEFPVFSDVNSCVRRSAWERVPFRDVAYAEDFHLSRDLLAAGFSLAYVPDAAVHHSNKYTLREHLGRMLDEVGALPQWDTPVRLPWVVRDWARHVREDAGFALRRSARRAVRDIPWAAVAEGQRSLALYLHNSRPETFERLARRRSLEAQRRVVLSDR
jgi:rhamnosyltransferase